MKRWIMGWWHASQRVTDLRVLWPACRNSAPDILQARAVFALHAFQDDAWLTLGEPEITRRISELT
jgi:hypothetical protein